MLVLFNRLSTNEPMEMKLQCLPHIGRRSSFTVFVEPPLPVRRSGHFPFRTIDAGTVAVAEQPGRPD
jgi:hypothetical protein